MTKGQPITNESIQSGSEVVREQLLSPTPIDRILQKLSCIELPAKDHLAHLCEGKSIFNTLSDRLPVSDPAFVI
jgi:hypothetical protein